ncbi:hypothetical protein [uncultured Eudoraea sp.]|uniref:hypothetical protein n=1 Tax=uncultured Eudoraea sp. TaxID=1035614 RepID=UPI002606CE9C|nr:hypothetical protein [uncultured Eudoraea sp.]
MKGKKRHWFWNLLIVLTVIVCILSFLAHYKNWIWKKPDGIEILSGVYYMELPFNRMNKVSMVNKIPSLDRKNGFSAWEKEKGIFKDSLNEEKLVYVYVDNLYHPKIRLTYNDSLLLFINLSDSVKTKELYLYLEEKIDTQEIQLIQ